MVGLKDSPRALVAGAVGVVFSAVQAVNKSLDKYQPCCVIVCSVFGTVAFLHIRRVLRRSDRPLLKRIHGSVFAFLRRLPMFRAEVEKKLDDTRKQMMEVIHKCDKERSFLEVLPLSGLETSEIVSLASRYEAMGELNVDEGRVSGAVYTDRAASHMKLLGQIFVMYAYANPLHPNVFPGCRKMEAEVLRMVADMYHGGPEVCGTMTTGGTESIMLAMFAYRNRANAIGISDPEIIVPVTAHAAFDKAAELLNIRIKHVRVGPDYRVDIRAMKRAISSETCVLVASAPNFPSGTMDDIVEISKLGKRYGVPVHVDACLGGFLIPFMEEAGFKLPLFDFRLPGVTSISCDTHKYGYAPKGTSVLLYRNTDYLHHQYFCVPEWTGGLYATPTLAGSRCGSSTALTWATLLHFGRSGYVQRTKAIIECTRQIADAIRGTADQPGIAGLELLGCPDVSVVAFTSNLFNIYAVADKMGERGWDLNSLQYPPAVHICVTFNTATSNAAAAFCDDLRSVTEELSKDPGKGDRSNTAAIYGLATSVADKTLVSEVAFAYLDACYAVPPRGETS